MIIFSKYFIALLGLFFSTSAFFYSFAQSAKFNVDSINSTVQKLSSDTERVNSLIDFASLIYCEDSGKKLTIANEAKKLAEKIKWQAGIIKSTRTLGNIYFDCVKNYPKAFEYFLDDITIAKLNNDTTRETDALENIATRYSLLDQNDKSIEFYNRILTLQPGSERNINILGEMGVAYNAIGDYANALASYSNALQLFDSLSRLEKIHEPKDTALLAGLLLKLGDIYLEMQMPDKAFEKYSNALYNGGAEGNKTIKILSLTGIGESYRIKRDYPQAIEYYRRALDECSRINDFKNEVKILDELANTYLETWTLDKALEFADSSIRLAEVQSYVDLLAKSYITFGNVYLRKNDYALAISYLQKALNFARQTKQLEYERDAWNSLSIAYENDTQPKEALDAYRHYISIRDSVYNVAKSNELIRREVEFSARETQIADSLKQAGVFGKRIGQQKMITYTGFTGLVLVLLLAFFIYRSYNVQRKYNQLLSGEKTRHLAHIEAQSNVLSDIAHIQAHQVRGPVATILGLIQIFNYNDPTDPINKEVMEGLSVVTEKLDAVVKEVIYKENDLRNEEGQDNKSS